MISLARLSIFKSNYVADTKDTTDDRYAICLVAASEFVEKYCGQIFRQGKFEEYYTGNDTGRLYLNNRPVTSVEWVKLWDGVSAFYTEDATTYRLRDKVYIQYPVLGKEAAAYWGRFSDDYEDGIQVKYTAGYPCSTWNTAKIDDPFGVPADLEHAVSQIALKTWKDGVAGGGRFGLTSMSKGGDSISPDKFIMGLPDDTIMILRQYARYLL